MCGDVARDDSGARNGGLEYRDSKGFVARETHEDVGSSQPSVEDAGGNVAQQLDPIREQEPSCPVKDASPRWTGPKDDEFVISGQKWQRLDDPLDLLVRLEPT